LTCQCEAIGIGQLKTISNDNTVMYWTMLHTPNSTGTILSSDEYMMDNPAVHTFKHQGNKNGTGSIDFTDQSGEIITAIAMKRQHYGLWYTTNPVLLPPLDQDIDLTTVETDDDQKPSIQKTAAAKAPTTLEQPNELPRYETKTWTANAIKATKQLKLWHQRMCHPSPRALYHTQRVVEGIPALPHNCPIFKCPFYDMAKLRKTNRNK
jgi:hypothetical protein